MFVAESSKRIKTKIWKIQIPIFWRFRWRKQVIQVFVFTAKPKWRLLRNGPESSAHMSKQSTLRLGWSTPVAKLLIVEATKNAHRYITCGNMAVIKPIRHVQEKRMKYLCLFNLSNTSPAVKPPLLKKFLDHLLWPDWSKNMK